MARKWSIRGFRRLLAPLFSRQMLALVAVFALLIQSIVYIDSSKPRVTSQLPLRLHQSTSYYQPPQINGNGHHRPKIFRPNTSLPAWHGSITPLYLPPAAAPVVSRVPTTEPVIFLGIDDGWVQTKEMQNWLTRHRLPFSLFLTNDGIKNNYEYFRQLQLTGMGIENHALSHIKLTKMNLEDQKKEICGAADTYQNVFGRRPTLLRPPYGMLNDETKRAAAECGMRAIVMWRAFVDNGAVHFQDDRTHFEPGDIVLIHFEHDFQRDIEVFISQAQADHLQVARLEDWLQ